MKRGQIKAHVAATMDIHTNSAGANRGHRVEMTSTSAAFRCVWVPGVDDIFTLLVDIAGVSGGHRVETTSTSAAFRRIWVPGVHDNYVGRYVKNKILSCGRQKTVAPSLDLSKQPSPYELGFSLE